MIYNINTLVWWAKCQQHYCKTMSIIKIIIIILLIRRDFPAAVWVPAPIGRTAGNQEKNTGLPRRPGLLLMGTVSVVPLTADAPEWAIMILAVTLVDLSNSNGILALHLTRILNWAGPHCLMSRGSLVSMSCWPEVIVCVAIEEVLTALIDLSVCICNCCCVENTSPYSVKQFNSEKDVIHISFMNETEDRFLQLHIVFQRCTWIQKEQQSPQRER